MRHRLLQNSSESEENWSTSNSVQVCTGVLPVPPSGDRWNVNFFHFRRFTRFISSHFHSVPTQKKWENASWLNDEAAHTQTIRLPVQVRILFCVSEDLQLRDFPPCSYSSLTLATILFFPEEFSRNRRCHGDGGGGGRVKQGEEGGTGVRLPLDHFSTRWKWNSFFSIVVPFCPGFGTAKTQRLLRIKADLTKIAI